MAEDRSEEINTEPSKRKGLAGLFENFIRKFNFLSYVLFLTPLGIIYIFCMGSAITPVVAIFMTTLKCTAEWEPLWRYVALGFSLGLGFVAFIFSLLFVVPLVNFVITSLFKVKPYRGAWFSLPSLPWVIHNMLTYMVRYTILDFITPTPLNILFYKMMGMKIGKGVMINTTNISDPCMISIGDYSTIGGSATLMAHYGMKGFLIIDKLTIGPKATIGLKASIFGGVSIGEKALVAPGATVLPKTIIEDGEKYGFQHLKSENMAEG